LFPSCLLAGSCTRKKKPSPALGMGMGTGVLAGQVEVEGSMMN